MAARYYTPERVRFPMDSYREWAEAVHLDETAVFTSLYTGEVMLRYGDKPHEFMSASPNQRRRGPFAYEALASAVLVHAVMMA